MASTYSTSLKLELIGSGDQSGTWGTTTNTNLGTLLEQAIVGQTTITMANADYTLTDYNGASDEARNAVIIISGSQNASYNVICPAVQKLYLITNSLSASATAYFKPVGGSAISIANGYTVLVYCTGSALVPLNYVQNAGNATTATTATTATNATNATNATTATNLAGGAANRVAYQSGVGTTTFISAPTTAGTGITWNGSNIAWGVVGGAVADGCIYENKQTILTNYTMSTSQNGESVGPITINSGVTVTIPTGSRWVVL